MVRKITIILILLCLSVSNIILLSPSNVQASSFNDVSVYTIYDDNFQVLFEKDNVEVGDGYMQDNGKYYEVVYVDEDNHTGIAKFIRYKKIPKVHTEFNPKTISIDGKRIAMYMTHNDESYVVGDGVDSIYGNGGIKDVALALKNELENKLIDVYFDDTLHIPHDSSAYSRSNVTARNLMNKYSPDALFDIHRDGASRAYYIANVDGIERCKVRIVVGKANPNFDINDEFAMYLFGVGKEMYPWLFTDIFYAKGHYNQALDGKALLFEMGSHLVEKNLVISSTKELADVVTTALYNTTVDTNTGELAINGVEDDTNVVVNKLIESKEPKRAGALSLSIAIVLLAAIFVISIVMFARNYKNFKDEVKK